MLYARWTRYQVLAQTVHRRPLVDLALVDAVALVVKDIDDLYRAHDPQAGERWWRRIQRVSTWPTPEDDEEPPSWWFDDDGDTIRYDNEETP